MKKTLVALAVTSLVAASASAVTVYNQEGTKVDFDGSLRLLLSKAQSSSQERAHSNLSNNGSRFGVRVNHDLGNGAYALGRLEVRFADTGTDNFGDLYAKRAYVGLGHKDVGELTFGRQVTIGDDVSQAGFDYSFGLVPSTVVTSGNSVVRYDYKGVEGLQLGTSYNFAESRGDDKSTTTKNGEVVTGTAQNAYQFGAIYSVGDATVAAAYSRKNYATGTNTKRYDNAWLVGTSYSFDGVTLALDGGQLLKRKANVTEKTSFVAPGVKFQITDKNSVYGHYVYQHVANKDFDKNEKTKSHGVMLGTDYAVHKQVKLYVEGSYNKTTAYVSGQKDGTARDKAIGVGLRVFW